jgi:tetratricopeptide (TPR) repeat protein
MNPLRGGFGCKRRLGEAVLALAMVPALFAGAWAVPRSRRQENGSGKEQIQLPPEAKQAIAEIYEGDPAAALQVASRMEKQQPDDALGYIIEAEARWWTLYCTHSEIRYGMVDLWTLPKGSAEKAYMTAAEHATRLGQRKIKTQETAQDQLWTGMGYALEARMYAAQGQKMATARAGVKARSHLLRAMALDPQLADADTGLGLYNYYVDTLSPIVKVLRVFLGIPGGSKQKGMEQLSRAMHDGKITAVEARFYLATNLRTYDRDYAKALTVAPPLARDYPQNPVFLLLIGNLELELGREKEAASTLARINQLKIPDAACAERSRQLAHGLLGQK